MAALIEARDLRRTFDGLVAVDGLSLTVGEGEIVALVGPDGAGKTTTMRLLCGALRPDAGEMRIAGLDLARLPDQARSRLGYLPQRFSLYGELTVLENLRFFAEVRGLGPEAWRPRALEILEFVGLAEFLDRRAEALSGGMKQKLGLAVALVHRPQVLLLDEPTGGVDPVTRQSFWQLLIRLAKEGVAVLISTPYMDEAARCNRVVFMDRGRALVEGTPTELRRRLEGRVLEVAGGPRRTLEALARQDPEVESVQAFGDRLHLRVRPGGARSVARRLKRAARRAGAQVERARAVEAGLEDVFLALLEGAR